MIVGNNFNLPRGRHQSHPHHQHQASFELTPRFLSTCHRPSQNPPHPAALCPSPTAECHIQTLGLFISCCQLSQVTVTDWWFSVFYLSFLTMDPSRQAWLPSKPVGMTSEGKPGLSELWPDSLTSFIHLEFKFGTGTGWYGPKDGTAPRTSHLERLAKPMARWPEMVREINYHRDIHWDRKKIEGDSFYRGGRSCQHSS